MTVAVVYRSHVHRYKRLFWHTRITMRWRTASRIYKPNVKDHILMSSRKLGVVTILLAHIALMLTLWIILSSTRSIPIVIANTVCLISNLFFIIFILIREKGGNEWNEIIYIAIRAHKHFESYAYLIIWVRSFLTGLALRRKDRTNWSIIVSFKVHIIFKTSKGNCISK